MRFSPDGQLLASVSADKTVKVWKVSDGSLQEPPSSAPPDDPAAASSSKAGADVLQKEQHAGGINDVAWNSNSTYLATASDDLTAKIWDVETRKCLASYVGHTNYVFCCQFNPQSTILVRECGIRAPVVWHDLQCTAMAVEEQAQLLRLLYKCWALCPTLQKTLCAASPLPLCAHVVPAVYVMPAWNVAEVTC